MWQARTEVLPNSDTRRITFQDAARPLSFRNALALWQSDPVFVEQFDALLRTSPFEACFWETPPVTSKSIDRDFECVLVNAPAFAGVPPDSHAFAEYFTAQPDDDVLTFPNLGHDAELVVPAPRAPLSAYPHLLAFARGAPHSQRMALWCEVGAAVETRLGDQPLWLSTAGLGIFWLHVRLDSRPKYYTHGAYRSGA